MTNALDSAYTAPPLPPVVVVVSTPVSGSVVVVLTPVALLLDMLPPDSSTVPVPAQTAPPLGALLSVMLPLISLKVSVSICTAPPFTVAVLWSMDTLLPLTFT